MVYWYLIFQTEFPVYPSEGEPLDNNSRQEIFLQPIVKQGPEILVERVRYNEFMEQVHGGVEIKPVVLESYPHHI